MDGQTLRVPISKLQPKPAICLEKGRPVKEAMSLMKKENQTCVCVVENKRLMGIFSERDVLTKIVGHDRDVTKTTLHSVMTPNPEYLLIDDEVSFALNRMHVGGFRQIPLVNEDGIPQGILSVQDIARYIVNNLDNEKM
jgi:CBS domain-containing protein